MRVHAPSMITAVPAGWVVFRNLGENFEYRRALARLRQGRHEPDRHPRRRLRADCPAAGRRRPAHRWALPRRRHR
ncbi:hypothetical protein AB0C07_29715 [Actinoplanes missouriensis]|uniref:hypothetical protein n=1 Tax=Actinoplanes missouriensis TaxID=1866 RepID=UPI0033D40B1B